MGYAQDGNWYSSYSGANIDNLLGCGKINLIDTAAQTVDREIWWWIVKGTTEKYTFQQLKQQGIPCERNYFSKRKSEFYYLLSKRI